MLTDEVSYTIAADRFLSSVPGCSPVVDGVGTDLALGHGRNGVTGAGRVPAVLVIVWRPWARLRTGHGPENMAVIRHVAVNLLRQVKPTVSLKNRRKRAGWNTAYLETLIRQTA